MTQRSSRQRLQDILDAIVDIERFTAGRTFDTYLFDTMLRRAVERSVEIVSEASRHLPAELKDRHPSVPWRQIADIGNVFRHAYDDVNDRRVWTVVTDDLAPLKQVVIALIADADGRSGG